MMEIGVAQMIAELTAAQEDALLSDIADYLEEVQSEHGESWADRDPSEEESEAMTPPGSRPSAEIEDPMAPSMKETARGEYQSPSGKLYATKVFTFHD